VSVQRYDLDSGTFQLTSNPDCGLNSNGPLAAQAMWVAMDANGQTWVEEGTVHKICQDGSEVKFWYGWMSNPNGFSGFMWTRQISTGAQHRFFLTNGTDGYWRWYVDQTQFKQYYWPNLGFYDAAGLESHDQVGTINPHAYSGMVKQVNWSPWASWQPYGAWYTQPNPPMQGLYADAQDGDAWESH